MKQVIITVTLPDQFSCQEVIELLNYEHALEGLQAIDEIKTTIEFKD